MDKECGIDKDVIEYIRKLVRDGECLCNFPHACGVYHKENRR